MKNIKPVVIRYTTYRSNLRLQFKSDMVAVDERFLDTEWCEYVWYDIQNAALKEPE